MHARFVQKQEILCRLWHNDVFAGARNSCNGDPGEKCMDLHYNRDTGAFLGKTKMDEPLK